MALRSLDESYHEAFEQAQLSLAFETVEILAIIVMWEVGGIAVRQQVRLLRKR